MRAIQTAARWLFRGIIVFSVFATVFLGIVYLLMQRAPARIADSYLSALSQKSGLKFQLGSIDVTLLPLPSIAVSDIEITGPDLHVSAAWLSLRPDFLRMLTGSFQPASITLLRPRITASAPIDLASSVQISDFLDKMPSSEQGGSLKNFLRSNCKVDISQGHALINGANETAISVNGLRCVMELDGEGALRGLIRLGYLRSMRGQNLLLSLENFELTGHGDPLNLLEEANDVSLAGNIIIPGYISSSRIAIGFESSESGWIASTNISGHTALPGGETSFSLRGRTTKLADSRLVNFRAMEFHLGADSGRLDLTVALPAKDLGFKLSGKALLARLSLTQWLGFARNLNPGLQQALDNIVDASMDFSLDAKGLSVPRIDATCMGSRFTGHGSVADFRRPVVFLDLKSQLVNLGLALPESLGKAPPAPYFTHATLTPMPGKLLKKGETGIDYDIRLSAKKLLYGPLRIDDASLRVHPGKMDKNGLQDVLLTAKSNFYGGTVNGECILGAHQGPPIIITGKSQGVKAKLLSAALKLFPFDQGTFESSINVSSKGKDLKTFLAALRGTASASGQNAAFRHAPKEIFSSVTLAATLRSAFLRGEIPGFDGKWQGTLRSPEFNVAGSLDGQILMDDAAFNNLPGEVNVRFEKKLGIIPANAHLIAKGSWSARETKISLSNATFSLLDQKGRGHVKIDGGKMAWEGQLEAETPNLETSIRKFGFDNIKIPAVFRKARFQTDFTGNAETLRLTSLRGSAGQSSFNGSVAWQTKNGKPFFYFALSVDNFELGAEGASQTPARKGVPINVSFLRDFNAAGQIDCKNLAIMGLRFTTMHIPLRLDAGKLAFGPATGRFYGSGLQARGTVEFANGINFSSVLAVHDFDLGAASRDRKVEGTLRGKASVEGHAQGRITASGQLPGALNGSWSFTVIDGSWQGSKNGRPEGSPTRFDKAQGTGIIDRGILKSKNFSLKGSGLAVNGEGWINLVNDTLDCELNVNMRGLPEFPLHLYGTIKKTETSIGAGRMVANAIGGITSGMANVIGGIFKGALNIFR